ncbi:10096_t:CDS:2 [Entrophospora sp. SA101]|nr:10096_t:CDS:2 [Entrophospora sp. SA101]
MRGNKNSGPCAIKNCDNNDKNPEDVNFRTITDNVFKNIREHQDYESINYLRLNEQLCANHYMKYVAYYKRKQLNVNENSSNNIKINVTENGVLLSREDFDSLQEFTIIHRDNGKIIELMQNVVIKRYKSAELVGHIVNLYDKMKSHHISFIDSLIKVKIEEQSVPFVILSPKGIHYKPQSEKQLVMALHCALTAVEAFHGLNIMHRDIRWENLMKYADKDRWFIIDFDEACDSPSSVPYMQLDRRSHAPEIFSGNHDKSVDIWSIGHLILETSIKSELLTEYAERSLMLKDSKKRPTAKEALEWLCNRYKDILQTEFLISKY